MKKSKAQAGIEYMIIVGFVTFAIMTILVLAYFYSGLIKDKIRMNQIEGFTIQLINNAESVFFAGEPSETTIGLYLPAGVKEIQITENNILVNVSSSTGENIRVFKSRVPLQGTISPTEGIKSLSIEAKEDYILIEQSSL